MREKKITVTFDKDVHTVDESNTSSTTKERRRERERKGKRETTA
jgi:hypothetical protein